MNANSSMEPWRMRIAFTMATENVNPNMEPALKKLRSCTTDEGGVANTASTATRPVMSVVAVPRPVMSLVAVPRQPCAQLAITHEAALSAPMQLRQPESPEQVSVQGKEAASSAPPACWSAIRAYAADQRTEHEAGRGPRRIPEIDERYHRYGSWLKDRGQKGWEYLLKSALWRCSEPGQPSVALEPNIVAYDVEAGIEHWNLWYHPGTTAGNADLAMSDVLRHARLFLPSLQEAEVALWQNIPELRSVPEMAHAHVMLRPQTAETRSEVAELRTNWRLRSPWAEHERMGGRGHEVGF